MSQEEPLVHHHMIYQANVGRSDLGGEARVALGKFLYDLVAYIDMEVLIDPVLQFSEMRAWTGLIGIITSHISFHYWTAQQYVQLDIYSCKSFDHARTAAYLTKFWEASDVKTIFINRESGKDFVINELVT